MIFLFTVMGALLFVSGGGFGYSLAWVYIGVFFCPVIVITAYIFMFDKNLLQSRLSVGMTAETRPQQKVIQTVASLAFIAVFVVSGMDYRYGWCTPPQWLSYASDGLVGLSFLMIFFVFRQNSYLSATIGVQGGQKVISTGLYAIVRHPMYTGALIMMLFTPLALGSVFGIIPSAILAIVIYLRAIDEEKALKEELHGYAEYCKQVKYRLIPFVI